MKITLEFDDAPDFIRHVEHAVNGVFRRHSPETGVLVKINNWFGSNWLGFSGKALGALGIWHSTVMTHAPERERTPQVGFDHDLGGLGLGLGR